MTRISSSTRLLLLCAGVISAGCSMNRENPQPSGPEQRPSLSSTAAQDTPAAAQVTADQIEKAMQAASTPGQQHELLKSYVGTWEAEATMWPAPGAEPQVSRGVTVNKMILGDRYLEQKYTCKEKSEKFEGMGQVGYDNLAKKYVSTWIDTMSTGQFVEEGTYDPATKKIAMEGKLIDPVSGKVTTSKTLTSLVDNGQYTFEMYAPDQKGGEFKTLEIVYTKPAAGKKKVAAKK